MRTSTIIVSELGIVPQDYIECQTLGAAEIGRYLQLGDRNIYRLLKRLGIRKKRGFTIYEIERIMTRVYADRGKKVIKPVEEALSKECRRQKKAYFDSLPREPSGRIQRRSARQSG